MKAFVIMPAYNVAEVLEKTIKNIPKNEVQKIIVVNDGSTDSTPEVAKRLGVHVISHQKNKGYGATQVSGYKEAMRLGADIIVMVHGDNQYDPSMVPQFISKIRDEKYDVVSGTRMVLGDAYRNGMPLWKYIPNRLLTHLENFVFRTHLTDYHNGYRAYSAEFLKKIPLDYLSQKFDFDTDILVQAAIRHAKIAEIPHPTRYNKENSQMSFKKGVYYGLSILVTVAKYLLHRFGIYHQGVFSES